MSRPDSSPSPWPEDSQPQDPQFQNSQPQNSPVPSLAPQVPPAGGVRALDGNRAALALLIVQNVVSALMIRAGAGLGLSLLVSFLGTVLVGFTVFRPAMRALLADPRWRTPPSLVALWGFMLGFAASRAMVLAYITLVPDAANSVPQFLSKGPDLWILVLSAGLLIPLAEEVAFRGLMMRGHERAAGFGVGALASTVAFSLAHGVPASVVGIIPLAYVLARVVQASGSLWNAVIIHALNNTISVGLGAALSGRKLPDQQQALDLLKNEAVRLPLAGAGLLVGVALLLVTHLWLTPRPDPQVRSAPGPWVSAAYVVIVLFGLAVIVLGLPGVQAQLTNLRGIMR